MILDFSLVAPGGAATHAVGFLGALAEASDLPAGVLVALPANRSLLVDEEARLNAASIPTRRIGTTAPAGSWRSRVAGQVALPTLVLRLRPRVVLIPRDIGPIALPGRVVLVATNVLRWRTQVDLEDKLGRAPVAVRVVSSLKNWAAGRMGRRSSAVIAPSKVVAAELPPRSRLEVIPFGIDVEVAPPSPEPLHERRPLRMVVLSNVTRHKRIDLVVDLAAALIRDHGISATLDVWGGLGQKDVVDSLRDQISTSLGEAGRIRGPIAPEDRREMLIDADVLLVGSSVESFAFPLLEAQATGTLVVAPESDLVDEQCGDRGVKYPEGDAAAGAALLADTLRPERAEEVRANLEAGTIHAAGFTWERCVRETLVLLREVAEG